MEPHAVVVRERQVHGSLQGLHFFLKALVNGVRRRTGMR